MIDGRPVLAVIPARGGSKGLPGKNVRLLGGRPLLAWTIDAARRSALVDRVILSSDDPQAIDVARAAGCEVPFVRPAALAADDTPMVEVVLHALDQVPGYPVVVLLQPTSPLRTHADVDGALRRYARGDADTCVGVTEPDKSPYWMFTLDDGGLLAPLLGERYFTLRRQELPPAYLPNGAVYVADAAWLRRQRTFVGGRTAAWVMPKERSVDIDTLRDFQLAEGLIGI